MARPLSADIRLAATFAAVTATLMIAQQIASKSLRDALFLTHFPVSDLPLLIIAAAVLSLGMVIGMSRAMSRIAPAKLVPGLFILSAVLYGVEWVASGPFPKPVAVIVYIHTVTFGASSVSGFWSVINERFDPYIAKRVIGRIGGGATFGGLLGGLAVWQVAPHIELETLLPVLTAANLLCAAFLVRVGRSGRSDKKDGETKPASDEPVSAVSALRKTPYLRHIGLFVLLMALGTALFDYAFKARAAAAFSDGGELVTFFALFYTIVGVATFAVQNAAVRRVLVRFGMAPTLAVLPLTIFVFGIGSIVFPGIVAVVALRGLAMTSENSFHRSSYELLYTPLDPKTKRATKLIIDIGSDRLGTAVGSGVVLLLLAALAGGAEIVMLILCVGIAAALVAVLVWLNRGYVAALAESMRAGTVKHGVELSDHMIDEETANRAVARTMADVDFGDQLLDLGAARSRDGDSATGLSTREGRLREAIEAYRRQRSTAPDLAQRSESTPVSADADVDESQLLALINERDPLRLGEALRRGEFSAPRWAGHLLPLLSDPRMREVAERFLRRRSAAIVGQLVDGLLSRRLPDVARGRIAIVLSRTPMKRGADGLLRGLADERFDVAHQCAVALYRMTAVDASLAPQRSVLMSVIKDELARTSPERRSFTGPEGFEASPLFALAAGNVNMQLVHVFTLLALVADREPLSLAFHSLQVDDDAARGTALEYLENILPVDVRTVLFRKIDTGDALKARVPRDDELVIELGRALSNRGMTLAELREKYRRRADSSDSH